MVFPCLSIGILLTPLRKSTDKVGFARVFIDDNRASEPGYLRVEAEGYEIYEIEIDLVPGNPPQKVHLKKKVHPHDRPVMSIDQVQRALNIIADFAKRMCTEIPLYMSSQSSELTGEVNAELQGIISRLADLGVEGAIRYQDGENFGYLQKDLISALKESLNCRLKIWEDLKDRFDLNSEATKLTEDKIRESIEETERAVDKIQEVIEEEADAALKVETEKAVSLYYPGENTVIYDASSGDRWVGIGQIRNRYNSLPQFNALAHRDVQVGPIQLESGTADATSITTGQFSSGQPLYGREVWKFRKFEGDWKIVDVTFNERVNP